MGQLSQKITMAKRWAKILSGKTEVAVEQDVGKAYRVGEISGYYKEALESTEGNRKKGHAEAYREIRRGGRPMNERLIGRKGLDIKSDGYSGRGEACVVLIRHELGI